LKYNCITPNVNWWVDHNFAWQHNPKTMEPWSFKRQDCKFKWAKPNHTIG
jgi:hypothetical protein